MPVITIRGQLGSGTRDIGKLIANKLNINYLDREIIDEVAERLHSPREIIVGKEMPPSGFLGRIEQALARISDDYGYPMAPPPPTFALFPDDEKYRAGVEAVIKDIAEGRSVVIRGRGSQFILKDFPGAFHVMIVAPLEVRVKRVMQVQSLSEEEAWKEIAHFDKGRHEFSKRYFHADVDDPIHYDLVINSGYLDYATVASVVAYAAPLKKKTA